MTAIANLPDLRPSLLLDFANSGRVDPRIQCTRASSATCFGPDGKLRTVAANVPRIDYDPATGKCLGLLVEEAGTNLLPWSSNFGHSTWVKSGVTVEAAQLGFALKETAGNGTHDIRSAVQAGPGKFTFSAYVKAGARTQCRLFISDGVTGQVVASFDLQTGALPTISLSGNWSEASGSAKQLGGGWWRIWITATTATTGATLLPRIYAASSGGTTYNGEDGVVALYIDNAQLEAAALPTSYIPTEASAVTRAADIALVPITSAAGWFNPVEGSVVVSARQAGLIEDKDRSIFALSNNSFASRVVLRGKYVGSTSGGFVVASTSVFQASISTGNVVDRQLQKFAASFAPNSFALAVSGGLMGQDTDGAVPTGITQLVIGAGQVVGNEIINGHIANLAYYPRRLTNAELQRLTA